MTDNAILKRASLWRESLKALIPTLKAEWRWVTGVAAVAALAQILAGHGVDVDALKKNQELLKQNPEMLKQQLQMMSHTLFLALAQVAFIGIPSVYLFTVLYLRRVVAKNPPRMTGENFLYWFIQCARKYFLLLAPWFLLGIGVGGGVALKLPKAFVALAFILFVATAFYYLYAVLRLSLVSPIAILHREPVIKNSWDLTRGSCWRIFWNLFVQTFVLALVFLIPFLVVVFSSPVLGRASLAAITLSSVLQGAWQAVATMAAAIFVCNAYKILLQEKRQNSPSQPVQQ